MPCSPDLDPIHAVMTCMRVAQTRFAPGKCTLVIRTRAATALTGTADVPAITVTGSTWLAPFNTHIHIGCDAGAA